MSLSMKHMVLYFRAALILVLTVATAGFTYCALGALALTNRLPNSSPSSPGNCGDQNVQEMDGFAGLTSRRRTMEWLLARLTTSIEDDELEEDDGKSVPTSSQKIGAPPTIPGTPVSREELQPSFAKVRSVPAGQLEPPSSPGQLYSKDIPSGFIQVCWLGFNGRCNKTADTCYCWWAGASLKVSRSRVPPCYTYILAVANLDHEDVGRFTSDRHLSCASVSP